MRKITYAGAASAIALGLFAGSSLPAQATTQPVHHSATHVADIADKGTAATPFTVKTYGGPDKKSFDGIRFAGTGTPGSLVLVYYDAPGQSTGLIKGKHIAVGDGDVNASGHYAFTALFPDLPRGASTLSYHARLVDLDTFEVIGRVNGTRSLR